MKRFAIFCIVGLGILFGALAPTFTPTPASAYYYHHAITPTGITVTITATGITAITTAIAMPGIITIIGASTVTIIATGEKSGGDYVDRIARS